MTAAVLQGAPLVTFDADLWVNLPSRQYIRVLNICHKLGATILTNNVVLLSDETRVDFIYQISGLRAFTTEWKSAIPMEWAGRRVKVLPLERVIRSKEAANRPKDIAQLPILRDLLASQTQDTDT